MWQIILTSLSAVLFFGFVVLCVVCFGLFDCYSAYAPKWQTSIAGLNWWQVVTIWSALLIIPVTVISGMNNHWQFLGFLAPVSLLLVGASPNYATDKFQNVIHQVGAWSAVVFILAYSIAIPHLVLFYVPCVVIALALSLIFKGTLMFWAEMAMYGATYIILFATI